MGNLSTVHFTSSVSGAKAICGYDDGSYVTTTNPNQITCEDCKKLQEDGIDGPIIATYFPDDAVNHPKHYTSDPSGVECIQITRWRNFNIGNAIKYLWRAGLKDDDIVNANTKEVLAKDNSKHVEDLEKAVWYIQDEIKRLKGE